MRRPRVLIADDHALVTEGLQRILEREYEICGTCSNGRDLIRLAGELNPDVAVVDISMPLLNGLDAVRQLRKAGSPAKFVFITGNLDLALAAEAYRIGGAGYVLKHEAATELLKALREALMGRVYISPRLAGDALTGFLTEHPRTEGPKLSQREREVLQLLAEGRSAKEIAAVLGVSPRTIEFHKQNLAAKTGLRTTAELARYAARHGLV